MKTLVMFLSLAMTAAAQQPAPQSQIRVLPLRGNVFMLIGGGANVVASIGRDGVLLVDSGAAQSSQAMLNAVRELSRQVTASPMPQQSCVGLVHCQWWDSSKFLGTVAAPPARRPIIGIINTSSDADHVGGNTVLANAGSSYGVPNGDGAFVIAYEKAAVPSSTETYFGTDKKLNFINGEGVVVWHRPAAHTDGDSVVQFRGSEVLAIGDILNMASYPVFDAGKGGSIQGIIDSLNWILDIAVVEHMMEGGTMVVPGHGRVSDSADVAYYRDMVTIVRDRVREMIKRGMTLPQIKAAKLTRDYDPRFGRNPSWTADMFVEAVYRSLTSRGKE